jgi:hypothetical protein
MTAAQERAAWIKELRRISHNPERVIFAASPVNAEEVLSYLIGWGLARGIRESEQQSPSKRAADYHRLRGKD